MTAQPAPDLTGALADLARALDAGPRAEVEGCLHCYVEADLDHLRGPVAAIPDDLVSSVAAKVPDHWDDFPALYRRVAPRIVELLVTGRLHVDTELVAARLQGSGCWSTWAEHEQAAFDTVVDLWWRETLRHHPSATPADEVLAFLACTTTPLATRFDLWDGQPDGPADLHARDVLDLWLPDVIGEEPLLEIGWYEKVDIAPDVLAWLRRGVPSARVRRLDGWDARRVHGLLDYWEEQDPEAQAHRHPISGRPQAVCRAGSPG